MLVNRVILRTICQQHLEKTALDTLFMTIPTKFLP